MINYLRKRFIKDYDNVKNEEVRERHAHMSSLFGIITNAFLFIIKLIIGFISDSISIISDAFNNLTDTSSSLITLFGFKMAKKPADKKHPYGHERIEYVTGLIISLIIVFVGGALFYTSVEKIINYKEQEINVKITYISIAILVIAILVKLYQFYFYKKISNIINSVALKATAFDSLSDTFSTTLILIATIIELILYLNNIKVPFSLDGTVGVIASLLIVYSAIGLLKSEVDPLIGSPIDFKYREEIINFIKSYKIVLGTHDDMFNSYGPTKIFMTIHVEVESNITLLDAHQEIDKIEEDVKEKFNINLTIHIDPVIMDNDEINKLKELVDETLKQLSHDLSYHDLRISNRYQEPTVLFDVSCPFEFEMEDKNIIEYLKNKINEYNNKYDCIIEIDRKDKE